MTSQLIDLLTSLLVVAVLGLGVSRWFRWRRHAFLHRLSEMDDDQAKGTAMFELLSKRRPRAPHRGVTPVVISTAAHLIIVAVLVTVPVMYVATELPEVPEVLAFVASAPVPAPPPPPPPPAAIAKAEPRVTRPVPVTRAVVPIQPPTEIGEELTVDSADEEGVAGIFEGGVPGGVIGGIVGGLVSPAVIPPPPPPPPPPPVEQAPVRVGGAITAPALVKRVEPEYPQIAVNARVHGVVILEAVVDTGGRVEDVRVLRSIPLLDRAAMAAVRQWRYSPLLLNGTPQRFVLTVTVSFSLST